MVKREKNMKVVRFYGSRDIQIEEEEKRDLMEDDVRIKILWCGICDSDVLELSLIHI